MDLNKIKNMTQEQLVALLEKQEQDRLKAAQSKISVKISQRGAISVYGMGRFPITLYPSQWESLPYEQIVEFCQEHAEAITEAQEAWEALPDDEKARRTAKSAPSRDSARARLVSSMVEGD